MFSLMNTIGVPYLSSILVRSYSQMRYLPPFTAEDEFTAVLIRKDPNVSDPVNISRAVSDTMRQEMDKRHSAATPECAEAFLESNGRPLCVCIILCVCAERRGWPRSETDLISQPNIRNIRRFLKAWKTTSGRIAAVHGSILDGPSFCAASLHCSKSDGTFDLLSCLKCVRRECFGIFTGL